MLRWVFEWLDRSKDECLNGYLDAWMDGNWKDGMDTQVGENVCS